MQRAKETQGKAQREYSQLLTLYERMLAQLQRICDELKAPGAHSLVREIRRRTGGTADANLADLTSAVEDAIRILKVSESEAKLALISEPGAMEVDGAPNLPLPLARFLAERRQLPGFKYEVFQDEVRGWVIRWKEMTSMGTVRGCGQFYERPYAWLDE